MEEEIPKKLIEKIQKDTIIIYRTDNGALILSDLGSYSINKNVYEFDDEENIESLINLHYAIDELLLFQMGGKKWQKKVIEHKIEHGSDYECKDPKCEICHENEQL